MPKPAKGAKIWIHVGGIPGGEGEWQWLADDTNSPYEHNVASPVAVTIWHRGQYFDHKMRLGTFSDPAIATITVGAKGGKNLVHKGNAMTTSVWVTAAKGTTEKSVGNGGFSANGNSFCVSVGGVVR